MKYLISILHKKHTAWVILLISFLLTYIAWEISHISIENKLKERFYFQSQDITKAIEKRMLEYEIVLRAGIGLFKSKKDVSRNDWKVFTNELKLDKYFPGIQGLGFSKFIYPEKKNSFIKKIQSEGFPEFKIWPEGERKFYTSIIYLEPFDWRNKRAFGYDMMSEPNRYKAMQASIDTGLPQITNKIILVQETKDDVQNGFLMYLPLYYTEDIPNTIELRRKYIKGFVYSPFRIKDLLKGILGNDQKDINFELYDGKVISKETLLYNNDKSSSGIKYNNKDFKPKQSGLFEIHMSGNTWTLYLYTNPEYVSFSDEFIPLSVAIIGIIVDLLLFYIINSIAKKQKDTEILVEKATLELRESELRYRNLFDVIPIPIFLFDTKTLNLILANKATIDHYEYSEDEILKLSILALRPEDKIPELLETLKKANDKLITKETVHKKKSGELIDVILVSSPLSYQKIDARIVVIQDITERKKTLIELENAKSEAEKANRAKSQFLATMSHEIRTPMNGIIGTTQILLGNKISDKERIEYAHIILNSGNSLLTILNDILDLSKIESGKFELINKPTKLTEVIIETVELFYSSFSEKNLEFKINTKEIDQKYYILDPLRIRQMLSNLISNSIKFTEKGKIELFVNVLKVKDELINIKFIISDTGTGISKDKIEKLFHPFSQIDSSSTRKYGGTGLGLSIVKNLANLMKGEIGVESEIGHGSRFWFTIQTVETTEHENTKHKIESIKPEQENKITSHENFKILIVEDNPTNVKVIQLFLRKLKFNNIVAENGKIAIEKVINDSPDIILMDCQMPEMDGFEATEKIRAWEKEEGRKRIPIIALTAGAFEEDRNKSLDSGMDDFLTKPVNLEDLKNSINSFIEI